jgi:protein-S-isoprenylcysteine O-methyltransferase Ste14
MSHRGGEHLTGEHPVGDLGQLILFLLFLGVWISDMVFGYSSFPNASVPIAVRLPIGLVFLLISAYTFRTGVKIAFGKDAPQNCVIRKGVFGIVRHPMYSSVLILYLGLMILSISLGAVGVWIIAFCFYYYISRHEEKLLLARFGDEYRLYLREVPMWIPRIRRTR